MCKQTVFRNQQSRYAIGLNVCRFLFFESTFIWKVIEYLRYTLKITSVCVIVYACVHNGEHEYGCTHAVVHRGGEEADEGGGQPHLLCFIQVSLLFDAGHPRLAGGFSCLHFLPASLS